MTSPTPTPIPARRDEASLRPEHYPFWTEERVRFADLDINGHVNNIAFAIYAESGRAAFLAATGLWSVDDPSRQSVLAHVEIDYLQELKYPADLRVGLRVIEIGRTSFKLGAGIFRGDHCVALVRSVQVRIDARSKRPLALDEDEQRMLQAYGDPRRVG